MIQLPDRQVEVSLISYPFREGVEVVCEVDGREFRVSDRQLGESEALRLLASEIEAVL